MFIVLDAIDGAGKGRQRIELVNYLKEKGKEVRSLEFPVHNAFYETVIHPALQGEAKMNSASWVLSYLLDKTLHSDEIREYIGAKNKFMIVDGYFTTTIAYQSKLMQQIELDRLLDYAKSFEIPTPDIAIYLDVDPEIAMKRKELEEGHEEGLDMFEKSMSKQKKLRNIFTELAETNTYCRWGIVDGSGSIEQVRNNIITELKKYNFI